jgi:hypothetical protein
MNNQVFINVNKIIERDNKTSTYKFALLRGTIDIIQENSPFIKISGNSVEIPIGLLIEKWLLYYYPILESKTYIPQINGEKLAFEKQFKIVIEYYSSKNGFSAFYNDFKNKGVPDEIQKDFIDLARKLRDTITKMPMKYIGRSINNGYYSIFQYSNNRMSKHKVIDFESIIHDFGTFSIPFDYYEVFKILGSFISGQDAILFKWAEFSINASKKNLTLEKVVGEILKSPVKDRKVEESRNLYDRIIQKNNTVYCVWSGKEISICDIDHMIPFSIWKNNDLWNLLPSDPKTNNNKRDKIPSPELIEKQKDLILYYWEIAYENNPVRFQKEIQIALLGNIPFELWKEKAIIQLQKSCEYLIEKRGYELWKI